jgi:hypothetical protein
MPVSSRSRRYEFLLLIVKDSSVTKLVDLPVAPTRNDQRHQRIVSDSQVLHGTCCGVIAVATLPLYA